MTPSPHLIDTDSQRQTLVDTAGGTCPTASTHPECISEISAFVASSYSRTCGSDSNIDDARQLQPRHVRIRACSSQDIMCTRLQNSTRGGVAVSGIGRGPNNSDEQDATGSYSAQDVAGTHDPHPRCVPNTGQNIMSTTRRALHGWLTPIRRPHDRTPRRECGTCRSLPAVQNSSPSLRYSTQNSWLSGSTIVCMHLLLVMCQWRTAPSAPDHSRRHMRG